MTDSFIALRPFLNSVLIKAFTMINFLLSISTVDVASTGDVTIFSNFSCYFFFNSLAIWAYVV